MGSAPRAVGKSLAWHTRQGSSAHILADSVAIAIRSATETSSAGRHQAKRSTPPTPTQPSVPVLDSSCPPAKTLRTNSGCNLSDRKKRRSTTNGHTDERSQGQIQRFQAFPNPCLRGGQKRVSAATSFYAAFRPLFRQVGRWCTGIPFEPA